MDSAIKISFKVNSSQKEMIDSRMQENGFDDISAYLKVVALKTQNFTFKPTEASSQEATIELSFEVNESQKISIEEKVKVNECENLTNYLRHVALHSAITSSIEVRSTGTLDAILERIAASRKA